MKKTLLLMGILLSFLSCQKDADKACPYLNTTEKHVNDLGVPIQTCGESTVKNLSFAKQFYLLEPGVFWYEEHYGKLKIYQDAKYLYFEYENINNNYEQDYLIYVGPESILTQPDQEKKEKFFYRSNTPKYKIPLKTFGPNDEVAVLFYSKYEIEGDQGDFYSENLVLIGEEGLSDYNYDYISFRVYPKYFLYTINPCCSPNE